MTYVEMVVLSFQMNQSEPCTGKYKMLSTSPGRAVQHPKIKISLFSLPLACIWLSDYTLASKSRQIVMCNFQEIFLHGRDMFSLSPLPSDG